MSDSFVPKIILDPFSLLIINERGEIKRLFCPFLVLCISDIFPLSEGEKLIVERVDIKLDSEISYSIKSIFYSFKHFEILLNS